MLFDHRHADLFGGSRVHGRFEDYGGATLKITADGFARAEQWTEIWSMGLVDGCRNGNDYEVCVVKLRGVVRDAKQ